MRPIKLKKKIGAASQQPQGFVGGMGGLGGLGGLSVTGTKAGTVKQQPNLAAATPI